MFWALGPSRRARTDRPKRFRQSRDSPLHSPADLFGSVQVTLAPLGLQLPCHFQDIAGAKIAYGSLKAVCGIGQRFRVPSRDGLPDLRKHLRATIKENAYQPAKQLGVTSKTGCQSSRVEAVRSKLFLAAAAFPVAFLIFMVPLPET